MDIAPADNNTVNPPNRNTERVFKEKEMGRGAHSRALARSLACAAPRSSSALQCCSASSKCPRSMWYSAATPTTQQARSEAVVAQSSCARRGGAPRKRRASLPASHSATSGDCAPHTTPTQRPPLRREGEWWAAPAPPAFPAAVGTSPRPCPAHGPPCRAWPAKPTASCRPRRPAPRARSTLPHQHRHSFTFRHGRET